MQYGGLSLTIYILRLAFCREAHANGRRAVDKGKEAQIKAKNLGVMKYK